MRNIDPVKIKREFYPKNIMIGNYLLFAEKSRPFEIFESGSFPVDASGRICQATGFGLSNLALILHSDVLPDSSQPQALRN